jgi:tRNA(Ile)-lysidine synthase
MIDRFVESFRGHFPDLVGERLLVALSGGADSVALLCLLDETRDQLACLPFAAHVHHHLRGAEADADAAYCARLCGERGITVVRADLDPRPRRGQSSEAWLRSERYRLLEEARASHGCAATLTAHTLDDQAETVLLKLLRGAGPRGVAGIRRRRGKVARPLLDLRRDDLRGWLLERGVAWREDASNLSGDQPRAWVRHEILPRLAGKFPASSLQFAAFADVLAADEELLGDLLRRHGEWPEVGRAIPATRVESLPAPLLTRWVLELAARLPLREAPSRRQVEAVLAMVRGGAPAAVDLGLRFVLRRRGGSLHLSPPPCRPFPPQDVAVPSEVVLPGGFLARLGSAGGTAARHRTWLHPRLRERRLAWRSARPGERLAGSGRRLAHALAAAGIPPEWRRAWPLLEAGDTMTWVPGVAVMEGWAGAGGDGVLAELEEPWTGPERS